MSRKRTFLLMLSSVEKVRPEFFLEFINFIMR